MKWFVIAIINICLYSFINLQSAEASDVGTSLLSLEQQLFFAKDDSTKNRLSYQKINLLLESKQYEQLAFEIDRLAFNNGFDSIYSRAYSQLIQSLFLAQKHSLVTKIFERTSREVSSENGITLWYYHLCSRLEEDDEMELTKSIDSLCEIKSIAYGKSKDSIQNYEAKAYKTAKIMQYIFPGSGLIAFGKNKKGVINLLSTGAFAWLATHYFSIGYLSPAIVFGVFPFSKFYMGSQRHFSYLIEQKNLSNKKKVIANNEAYIYRFCRKLKH
jgi:hypothetical protein